MRFLVTAICIVVCVACNDLSGLAGKQQLPAGTPDPSVYRTAAGALALYQNTLVSFQSNYGVKNVSTTLGSGVTDTSAGAFVQFVLQSGLLTDELQAGDLGCTGACPLNSQDELDSRQLFENQGLADAVYIALQGIRNDATLGIGALATYDSAASPALRGHLYALTGYADLMLADLFCSGVPLSTINFGGSTSFSYAPGSSTSQIYTTANALFDTALVLSADSVRLENFAWVGKGRALLALGQYDAAAQAAAHVPNGYAYQFVVDWVGRAGYFGGNLLSCNSDAGSNCETVADHEGTNGLPYISKGDPRTTASVVAKNAYGRLQYFPLKYGGVTPGLFPITVADWIEARLIQAEAALHAGDPATMIRLLNQLRATAPIPGTSQPDSIALPPLNDPGTDTGRVSLLFYERAYWLFLTGHRQGDLRRLIRQYGRSPQRTYPTGIYPLSPPGTYGTDVVAPISTTEDVNPKFHGCLSQGA